MQVGLGGLCGKDHYMQSSPAPLPQSESADGLIATPTCRQGVSVLLKDFGPSIPRRSGTPLGAGAGDVGHPIFPVLLELCLCNVFLIPFG